MLEGRGMGSLARRDKTLEGRQQPCCTRRTAMKTMLGLCSVLAAFLLTGAATAFAHWPDQAPHQIAQLGEFTLEGGGVLEDLKMSFVTHGKLNAAKDNAIL